LTPKIPVSGIPILKFHAFTNRAISILPSHRVQRTLERMIALNARIGAAPRVPAGKSESSLTTMIHFGHISSRPLLSRMRQTQILGLPFSLVFHHL
jgi:hypothetical protein